MFAVYIIDRDGELDVYESLLDAEEAQAILRGEGCTGGFPIVEQVVFAESSADAGPSSTRAWLDSLRRSKEGVEDE